MNAKTKMEDSCLHLAVTRYHVSIRHHTSPYASIRHHTSPYVTIRRWRIASYTLLLQDTTQLHQNGLHTPAYVSIRQHTSAYVSIRRWRIAADALLLQGTVSREMSSKMKSNVSSEMEDSSSALLFQVVYAYSCTFYWGTKKH